MVQIVKSAQIVYQELRPKTFALLVLHLIIAYAFSWSVREPAFSLLSISILSAEGMQLFLGISLLASWYVNATSVNDLADEAIDTVNMAKAKDRPLINKAATDSELRSVSIAMAIIATVISVIAGGVWLFATTIAMLILNWVYSMPPVRLSYRGFYAPLLLPLGYVVFPFLISIILTGAKFYTLWLPLVTGFYLIFVARLLLKDFRDIKGDALHGKMTYLLRHGKDAVLKASIYSYITGSLLLMSVVFLMSKSSQPLNVVVAVVGMVLLLYFSKSPYVDLYRSETWDEQKKILPYLGRQMSMQSIILLGYVISTTIENGVFLLLLIEFILFWGSIRLRITYLQS